jgi:hypothetical protein
MSQKQPEFQAASLEAWHKAAAKSAPGGDVNALNWLTPDGISVKPLYTAEDTANLPYANTLPGFEPFLRGPQATMYAVKPWTIRQYAGFSTAEESNAFYRKALAAGGNRACRSRLTWPPTAATTATIRECGRRRQGRRGDRLVEDMKDPVQRDPARQGVACR